VNSRGSFTTVTQVVPVRRRSGRSSADRTRYRSDIPSRLIELVADQNPRWKRYAVTGEPHRNDLRLSSCQSASEWNRQSRRCGACLDLCVDRVKRGIRDAPLKSLGKCIHTHMIRRTSIHQRSHGAGTWLWLAGTSPPVPSQDVTTMN